ncbi:hypothetical protein KKB11_05465, partial [Candidatus Micrarchaeota archaeon]|nr:hypothetical protein [Candidatus Micrarchaeota archaeon]
KKIIFFIMLLLASTAFAAETEKSSVNVIVDSEGTALIEETFFVGFEEGEKDFFKQSIEQGITLDTLKSFGLEIKPRLENTESLISFEETQEANKIKLNYFSNALFSIKNMVTFNEFSLNTAKFSFLFSGEKIVFPENFSLRFVLPKEAKEISVLPQTNISSNTIEWKGELTGNELLLSYSIEKTPEPLIIKETSIGIDVKEDGFGKMSEKYFFGFRSQEELDYFVGISKKNGSSLLSWNTFDQRIFPHVGEDEFDTKNASVDFVQQGLQNSYLSIAYENESPVFIENKEKAGRLVEWEFNSKKLNKLLSGGLIILPENTTIEITLPSNAEIKETNLETEKGKIIWKGYKTTSQITLIYLIKENIAPAFNLSLMVQGIVSKKETLAVLIAAVIAVAVILSLKRDSITERIDKFIINNSKIEKEEEIELDVEN